jgi:hypothetical protein
LAIPFANNAHVLPSPPAEIATAAAPDDRPLTTTGIDEFVVVLFPNCPKPLAPQHPAVPFANNAHELLPPAEIATAFDRPLTTTGIFAFVVVLFPNCPEKL